MNENLQEKKQWKPLLTGYLKVTIGILNSSIAVCLCMCSVNNTIIITK